MTHDLMTLTKLKDDSIGIGLGLGIGLGVGLGVGLGAGLPGLIIEFESVRDGLIIALTLSHWVMSHVIAIPLQSIAPTFRLSAIYSYSTIMGTEKYNNKLAANVLVVNM